MKTVVVTGATSGIGYAVAKELVERNNRVVAIGRTKENCAAAEQSLKKDVPDAEIVFFYADLSEQRAVNAVADQVGDYLVAHCDGKLDVLINNAGGIRNWYTTTADGYELQFALNHLSGFLLTYRLMQYFEKGGRMILTGSNSHKHTKINWKDIMLKKRYSCLRAYKQSKLCNMLFAKEFNRQFSNRGIRAYVVDPGLVNTDIGSKQTSGIVSKFWSLRKRGGVSPKISAQCYTYLCNQMPEPDGLYYHRCKKSAYSRYADSEPDARELFELSKTLCGINDFGGKEE